MPSIRFLQDGRGRRVAYAVHGEGPHLICPAWWVSHLERDWEEPEFREFFEALGQRFTVVRYDRPGVGLSDRDASEPSPAADADLLSRLIEKSDAGAVHLLGISCGGPVCLSFAVQWPDRVRRIALYGTYLRGTEVGNQQVRDAMVALVRAHWGLGSRTLADVFVPGMDERSTRRFVTRQRDSADAQTAADLLGLTYRLDATELAPRVRAPVVVIHRRGDRAIPFECGRSMAAAIPDATFVPLEGSVHPPWAGGAEVARVVAEFLADERSGPEIGRRLDCRLDEQSRAVVIEGRSIGLTRLEFGLLRHLSGCHGTVVSRDELLREVWRQEFVGSNVVDAAVRSVRRKLGSFAESIETVKGHGYRFAGFRKKP